MTKGRPQLSKQEAIEALRAQIQPEQYLTGLENMKATYLDRAAELLGNHDLNMASPAIDERDVDMVNVRVDEALADLSWRVQAIDERIADFKEKKENVTRPFERSPTDTEAELSEDEAARVAVAAAEDALAASPVAPEVVAGEDAAFVEADPNEEA